MIMAPQSIPAADVAGAATAVARPQPRARVRHQTTALMLAAIVSVYAVATMMSMRQTSTTFDEILMPAAGARGYVTGDFDLMSWCHPRLAQYFYGLPVLLSRPTYPEETGIYGRPETGFPYARGLFFDHGNNGQELAFRARLVAVAFGATLVLLVFAYVRRYYGHVPALLAAGMTAFLPDLLAHGGITYNDVPNAIAFFAAVWGLDRAAANPTLKSVSWAALLTALALAVKFSAIALAPIALVLIGVEAVARGRQWKRYIVRTLPLLPFAAGVVYLVLVAIYLGDFTLASFRYGLDFNIKHATTGHEVPALLLGRGSVDGFWYFFPVAFLIKTPAALHILLVIAALGVVVRRNDLRSMLHSPLRGPALAALVFLAFLLSSNLNIGFRHALPLLPLVIVIAAAGLGRVWAARPRLRLVIAALVAVQAASVLSWYPHFIPYTSEYFPNRDLGLTRLTDSSHDWGQGLPLLRDFMAREGVATVYLSYFGSAMPAAYGVHYVPLASAFPLDPLPEPAAEPRFIAISATNLVGTYVGDTFAAFKRVEPYQVLGHSIFIYKVDN
jgi:hypothetical protein